MEFVRPQKAKPVAKWIEKVRSAPAGKYRYDLKLDGHRRVVDRDNCWSGDGFDVPYAQIQTRIHPGWQLDGELIPRVGRCISHEVTHLLAHDPSALQLVPFDCLATPEHGSILHWPQRLRDEQLDRFMALLMTDDLHWIRPNDPNVPQSLDAAIEYAASLGVEGIMVKETDRPYGPGSRSAWQKHKFVATYDAVIIDAEAYPSKWRVKPGARDTNGVLLPEGRLTDPWLAGYRGLRYGYVDQKTGKLRVVGDLGWTAPPDELVKYLGHVVELKSFGPREKTGCLRHQQVEGWRTGGRVDLGPLAIPVLDYKAAADCTFDFERGEGPDA